MSHSRIYTKRYADNKQRDPKWRARNGIVHNPRANFHYPHPSIKARERGDFKQPIVRQRVAQARALRDRLLAEHDDAA